MLMVAEREKVLGKGVAPRPAKRDSIDARMARSVIRVRAEMFEDMTSHLLITDKPEFFKLPVLGAVAEGKFPEWWMPRHHPISGAVYTTKWDDANLCLTEDGKHHALKDAERFVILRQPDWRKNVDLNALPKSWEVQAFIPQELKSIEGAMRQQDEIRYDYGLKSGPEYMRVEELFVAIYEFSHMYARGEVTKDSLQDLSIWIAERLEEQGLFTARDPLWLDLTEALTLAFQEHPSGKYYPLAVRMRMLKALRDLVKLEVETSMTRRKADRVFNLLFVEREDERFAVKEARKEIVRIGGFDGKEENPIFRKSRHEIRDEEITRVRHELKKARENLKLVRVAPYFIISRLAEAMLGSNQFRDKWEKDRLLEILTVKELDFIPKDDSVEDLLMKREPQGAHKRLSHVHYLLNAVLTDEDNDEITVFD